MGDIRVKLNRIICLVITALLIVQFTCFDSFARDEVDPLTMEKHLFTSEYLKFADDSRLQNVKTIKYKFLDTSSIAYDWGFPYSDDFFRHSSKEFSMTHAKAGLGLALSAFRNDTIPMQYKKYLGDAGFTNFFEFGYDKPTSVDSLSGVIGMKVVDDFTVIAAVTCGQGYKKEWAGNFILGRGIKHKGFNTAAQKLETYIADFIKINNIDGKKKLWLGGSSRAAAIANIAAADSIESGDYEDVYAYLFGVPRTTKEPKNYEGIYNICGEYDPVASMPLQSWNYERYGMDLYTPAQESDYEFPTLAAEASNVSKELSGKGYRNNPEVNYQIRLILEWMNEFFKDSNDFDERLSPLLQEAVLNSGPEQMISLLGSSISKLKPKNDKEKESIKIAADYISYIVAQHTRANQRQIEDGSWDPDESVASNFVIEHRGSQYIKWLFSDLEPNRILDGGNSSRRVTVIGNADVSTYFEGLGVTKIDAHGNISAPDVELLSSNIAEHGVFMMRNGSETIVSLPGDKEYTLKLEPTIPGTVSYYGLLVSGSELATPMGDMKIFNLKPAEYSVEVKPGDDLTNPINAKGREYKGGTSNYNYSPTMVMSGELDATKYTHMSLSNAYHFVMAMLIGLLILLAVCVIIYWVHRKKRKQGHPPYSNLYVIIPHLIFIAVFAVLTQFVAYYLYSIDGARAQCASLTVFFIFLLALRGVIRSKNVTKVGIAMGFLVLAYMTGTYYNNLPIDSFSKPNMAIFFTTVIALSAAAVSLFKRDEDGIAIQDKEASE